MHRLRESLKKEKEAFENENKQLKVEKNNL